jgi:DNA invertase Pin-like site-specific DNA recombinase
VIYGYARTSSPNQKDNNSKEVQRDELIRAGAQKIIYENYTGTKLDRPKFSALIKSLQSGDTLIVTKLDRFARAMDAAALINELVNRGVRVHILNMGVMDTTPFGELSVNMMSAFAKYERDMIVERTQAGIAKKRELEPDWKEGRPRGEYPDFPKFHKKQKDGLITVVDACAEMGISRSQWYRLVREVA